MVKLTEERIGIGLINLKEDSDSEFYKINDCKDAIKLALLSGGLGKINPKVPLKDILNPGCFILVKPNWVTHWNYNKCHDIDCLITHPNIIEAVLDQLEGCNPSRVIIGDAPIQGCQFDKVAPPAWRDMIQSKYSFPVEILDFRQTILTTGDSNDPPFSCENLNRKDEDYILFDLGTSSSLEEISGNSDNFRVAMYNHRELNKVHKKGKHKYLIAKELFEVDVILNLPKLKTHKKTGMTGALKNLVGINGSKHYLPHHRIGSTKMGGDNYEGFSILKSISEFFTDQANKRIGQRSYRRFKNVSAYFSSFSNKIGHNVDLEGGWYGNDTTWRMVLDLNKIILYGTRNGELNQTPMRKVYSITDAIIAGDTEGPLSVEPVKLGLITYSDSTVFADMIHAYLMHFDWRKIPCIREAFEVKDFCIVHYSPEKCQVVVNGQEIRLDELATRYGKSFRPPKYWEGHIEIE